MNNTELLDPTELVSRIRGAVGDKDSLLTQQELIRHCKGCMMEDSFIFVGLISCKSTKANART